MGTGVVTTVYRAAVEITRVQCAGAIALGALYSHQTHRTPLHAPVQTTRAMTTEPICVTCRCRT